MNKKFSVSDVMRKIVSGLSEVLRRYPAAVALAAAASVCGIILVNLDNPSEETERLLASIIMAAILGLLVSVVVRTVFENNPAKLRIRVFTWIVFGCGILLYIAYLYGMMERVELFQVLRLVALCLAFFVMFMTAVFRRKTGYQEVFSTVAGWRLAITAVYTLIIWGGVSLILFAIDRLLGVRIEEEAYMDAILITLGFFSPVFFLSGVPHGDEPMEPDRIYKFFRILVIYVIAPLLTAYSVVFYIYSLRILINWNWPDGIVANMVLWYALIGTVTMYFIHGMDTDSKWASFFGRWFPRIVILPIVLLFISLGIRINAYGITANRYLLGITGVWMLGCAVYMSIVNYKTRCTRVITVSLAILAVLSVVGPWNAINIGRISQTNRLEKILVENNILQPDGSIVRNTAIDEETKGEISDKLRYLEYNYDYKKVDFLPADFETSDMQKVFGFEYTYYYPEMPDTSKDDYVMINDTILGSVVALDGYEYIWDSEKWGYTEPPEAQGRLGFRFLRDSDGSVLDVIFDGETELSMAIDGYIGDILEAWDEKDGDVTYDDMTFDIQTESLDLRLIFTGVELYPDDKGFEMGWVRFYVLAKIR
ncbi:MAG TPA: DUF4153 domain-containing protein [Clostridia bacterium]|nr:DUF4153 domain-containing protein [Clostridia bacterium]